MNENKTNINWFPGHMVKALNEIKSNIKLIDILCVILDARIPDSSKNDEIFNIAKAKPVIIVFNKIDLADMEKVNTKKKEYEKNGYEVMLLNANDGQGIDNLVTKILEVGKQNKKKYNTDQITPIYRVLVAGIPNVGKSTIINKLAGKKIASVGNKPGVTKSKQWIKINNNIELLDTPGILWPKLDKNNAGEKLALTGNIKDEILDMESLAITCIKYLRSEPKYLEYLVKRYKLDEYTSELTDLEVFEAIGKKRGAIISKGEVDYNKTARVVIDEFRAGVIGKISLE